MPYLRKLVLLSTAALALVFSANSAQAEEKILEYNVDIQILENSYINVSEKIHYNFGDLERRGIIRSIPLLYETYGDQVEIDFELESVTNENGEPHPFQVSEYGYVDVRIGDPDIYLSGDHRYHIDYKIGPVITRQDLNNQDELYFNAIGTQWSVPIEKSTVSVTLPTNISNSGNRTATCFTGYLSSQISNCNSEIQGNKYIYNLTQPLTNYEGFTIVAGFEQDLVTVPAKLNISPVSSPYDLNILVNGEDTNKGSGQNIFLAPGTYTITAEKKLYKSQDSEITLTEGQTQKLQFNLKATPLLNFIKKQLPIVIILLGTLWIIFHWYKYGRDPKGRGTIMPMFEIPDDLSPSEIGVIIDQRAHLHDISATIISLAVKKFLSIERTVKKKIFKDKVEYTFINTQGKKDLTKIPDHEQKVFNAIFGKKAKKKKLSHLKNKFYKNLPKIKKSLYESVVEKKYFPKDPDKVRKKYMTIALLLFFFGNGLGIGLAIITLSPLYMTFFTPLSALMMITSFWMPKVTKKGAEIREQILGLKMYLSTAEKDRIKKLQSPKVAKEIFEKFLPYAMVLEVEKEWAEQFEDLFDKPPSWFKNTGENFHFVDFTRSLNSLNTTALSTFKSAPSSSGSYSGWSGGASSWSGGSGFSSGGYSGGGFGGGGGSSW